MPTNVETFSETAALFALVEGRKDGASASVTVRPFGPDREYLCKGCVTRRRTAA